MPLSCQYINEIRQLVNQRNTSPRGVADANNFFTTTTNNQGGCNTTNTNDKEDGSCRYDVTITMVNTPDIDIDTCTTKFIKDVMTKAVTITEHFGRMTIVPCDVAMALECIAGQEQQQQSSSTAAVENTIDNMDDDDDEDEEMNETKVNSSAATSTEIQVHDIEKVRSGIIQLQATVRGVQVRDGQTLDYDCMLSSDDDDSNDGNELDDDDIRYDNTGYDAENTATPIFDVAYPPIGECINLTDEQFKDEIFFSIFNNEERRSTKCQIVIGKSCVPIGNGVPCSLGHIACDCEDRSDEEQEMVVMGMMKRATYAYLVAKLSC